MNICDISATEWTAIELSNIPFQTAVTAAAPVVLCHCNHWKAVSDDSC